MHFVFIKYVSIKPEIYMQIQAVSKECNVLDKVYRFRPYNIETNDIDATLI